MTRWHDPQSIIQSWPSERPGMAQNDTSSHFVEWPPGEPEKAVRKNMAGDILDDEDGIPRARRIAEARECKPKTARLSTSPG